MNTFFFSFFYSFLLSSDRAAVFFPAFFFSAFFFSIFFFSTEITTDKGFLLCSFRRYFDKFISVFCRYKTNTFFFLFFLSLFLSFDRAVVFFFNFFFSAEVFLSDALLPVESFFFTILGKILKNSLILLNKVDKLNFRI